MVDSDSVIRFKIVNDFAFNAGTGIAGNSVLVTIIQDHIQRGEELPGPGRMHGRNYRPIRLSALHTMKVELYQAFRSSGFRKAELARHLGIPKTVIDRLFDLSKRTRIDQIEAAFAVLGKQMEVLVRGAA